MMRAKAPGGGSSTVGGRCTMRIGLIGRGMVGGRVERLFARHAEIVAWDLQDDVAYPEHGLRDAAFVVVCVGTPGSSTGPLDVSAVDQAVGAAPNERILLKSTVPPGTIDRLVEETGKQICYWPEYTGESRYHNPYFPSEIEDVPFVVLGGLPPIRRWFIDKLLPVLGPTKRYFQCDALDAELIKCAENAFFAVKIGFVNEFRRICEGLGGDWHTVREGWLLDPRISPMHTAAFLDTPGFGGACLPKDLRGIIAAANASRVDAPLLCQVWASNGAQRASRGDLDVPSEPARQERTRANARRAGEP
jgi:UDPglucose 6-dehydrogenase